MMKWNGAALSAAMLLAILAIAAPATARERSPSPAADASARRHIHHYRPYAYRPYPTYYGRPVTYAPAPFLPIPPLWGYGWEWW